MQFWPRKRAKRIYPRIRSFDLSKPGLAGFAGYKAGMTHVIATDTHKHSLTKGEEISIPVTVVECPPIRIFSVRFYKHSVYGARVVKELRVADNKLLQLKVTKAKSIKSPKDLEAVSEGYDDVSVVVYTQPHLTGKKKKPELFELKLGGSLDEKLSFIKEYLDKDIRVSDVFKEGDFVDVHAVTKGKGYQGPVKRFGISLRSHKSEKTKRGPGSLGPWNAHAHILFRVAHAGQMGFHQRIQFNNQILKISDNPEEVNPKGGFVNYGLVKSDYILVKGSLPGSKKRLLLFTLPRLVHKELSLPTINYISTASKQGC